MRGFTLLETIVAVAILAIGIVASLTLISKSVQSVSISRNRLIASYLSGEGADLIRNIRDNNWKNNLEWTFSWPDCLNCEIDYTVNALSDIGDPFLKQDTSGFYNYTSGTDTPFKRRITVLTLGEEQRKVVSEVVWQDRGRDYSVKLEGYLYNWK